MTQTSKRAAMIAAALLTTMLCASPGLAAQVTITAAWFRALPGNLPSGGYFTLYNGTANAVALTGAESPACGMLMLHKSNEMNGMSSMSYVSSIDVPAGGTLKFAPGGYHLMCMDPTELLKQGATVQVILHFADGSKIAAPFLVRSATGK